MTLNILEAYEAVKAGLIIKATIPNYKDDPTTTYVLQTTLQPFGEKSLVQIGTDEQGDSDNMPTVIGDLDHEELCSVCIRAFEDGFFEVVTQDEMMQAMRRKWLEEYGND